MIGFIMKVSSETSGKDVFILKFSGKGVMVGSNE